VALRLSVAAEIAAGLPLPGRAEMTVGIPEDRER